MEKAEVIKAFHLMWDNYPESAMLIDKKRNIIAANKVAPSTGRIEGNKCALVEPLEQHKGCRAEEAWKNGEASYLFLKVLQNLVELATRPASCMMHQTHSPL